MKKTADNAAAGSFEPDRALAMRVMWTMVVTVSLAVIVSLPLTPWRVAAGLLLGGSLSLLNLYWLRSSVAAVFDHALGHGQKPRIRLVTYVLRYFVVVGVVFAAYQLNIVSLLATIAGLCSFVVALFVEAFREAYLAIIHREGIS